MSDELTGEHHARRYDPDTSKETARRIRLHAQMMVVLKSYGRHPHLALIDHDAYRLAGFPPGRTSHQRCSDLRARGYIERDGRGQTPSGHSAYKCKITAAGMKLLLAYEGR
jgi:hypothetical protein